MTHRRLLRPAAAPVAYLSVPGASGAITVGRRLLAELEQAGRIGTPAVAVGGLLIFQAGDLATIDAARGEGGMASRVARLSNEGTL